MKMYLLESHGSTCVSPSHPRLQKTGSALRGGRGSEGASERGPHSRWVSWESTLSLLHSLTRTVRNAPAGERHLEEKRDDPD